MADTAIAVVNAAEAWDWAITAAARPAVLEVNAALAELLATATACRAIAEVNAA